MDFLGTTTPASIIANVTTGVQDTGEALWPFLVFVGVALAFTIGALLIGFIRASISPDRSKKFLGVYVHDVPYKGYNRWRSADWNRKNTM